MTIPLTMVTSSQSCTQIPTPPFRSPSSTTPERSSPHPVSADFDDGAGRGSGLKPRVLGRPRTCPRVYRSGVTRTCVTTARPLPGSIEAGPARRPAGAEPGVVVQVGGVILMLATQGRSARKPCTPDGGWRISGGECCTSGCPGRSHRGQPSHLRWPVPCPVWVRGSRTVTMIDALSP